MSTEWISVHERLPEDQRRVLVCGSDENGCMFWLAQDFRVTGSYDAKYRSWNVDEDTCSRPQVDYWMPLPDLPVGYVADDEESTK